MLTTIGAQSGIWLQQFSGTISMSFCCVPVSDASVLTKSTAIWPRSRLSDFWYSLSDPSSLRLARMLLAGQQSTWPKILFMANRMKIQGLIQEGLLLGESPRSKAGNEASRSTRADVHATSQVKGSVQDAPSETDDANDSFGAERQNRRPSVIQELKRQSSVFFDDVAVDGEETGESEYEEFPQGFNDCKPAE